MLYELRHYFGSYLASIGVSPYDIADQMGHDDEGQQAQSTYIHTRSADSRARVREAIRRDQSKAREAS